MWCYWLRYFFGGADALNIFEKSFCSKNNRFHSKVIRKRNAITLMAFAALLTIASMRANAAIFSNTSTGAAIATSATWRGRVVPLIREIVVIPTAGLNSNNLSHHEIAYQKAIQNDSKMAYKAFITVHDDPLLYSVLSRILESTTINNRKSLQECHYKTTEVLLVNSSL
jgi:hypothetical protein